MSDFTSIGDLFQRAADIMDDAASAEHADVVRTRFTEEREPIPELVRHAVMRRDRFRCTWCHSKRHLQMDHIVPWSAGGSDGIENLRTLCEDCNQTRSNRASALDAETRLPWAQHGCLTCQGGDRTSDMTEVWCRRCNRRGIGKAAS